MKLYWPIKPGPGQTAPEISQYYGNDPVMQYDQWFGNVLVKKGEHLYKRLANMDGHNGLDMPAPLGTPIYAVHDGWIIEQISKDTGYGIRVAHYFEADGRHFVAIYGHMQRLEDNRDIKWNYFDRSSKWVKRGDVLGYVNSTGFSNGNHLHFGLTEFNKEGAKLNFFNGMQGSIDPMPYFTNKENKKMVGFKKGANPTVHTLQGGQWVPISSWDAFVDLGGSAESVITLTDQEFNKLTVASKAKFGV